MYQSMVNIQSPTAEIRRGKKEEERRNRMKILWSALLHRATIISYISPIRPEAAVDGCAPNLVQLCMGVTQGRLHHGGSGGGCPPCPCCTGAHGGREMPFTTTQVILYIEDSASISHNTDLVKLSEITDLQELTSEAQELPVYLNLHNRNSAAPITKVTKVSTFCDVMNSVSDSKDCLPHFHQLLKLYNHVSATGIRDSRAHVQCNAPSQILAAFVNVIEHVEQQDFQCHTQTTN